LPISKSTELSIKLCGLAVFAAEWFAQFRIVWTAAGGMTGSCSQAGLDG
jgi:hypothetical protein